MGPLNVKRSFSHVIVLGAGAPGWDAVEGKADDLMRPPGLKIYENE